MNVHQFLDATKISINRLSQLSGVNYGTLHAHLTKDGVIGLRAAKKLEAVVVEGHPARMSAAEILGLSTPSAPAA
jgi:hypothetical protein